MKNKLRAEGKLPAIRQSYDDKVRLEIAKFYQAIKSYPSRLSEDRHISFNRHLRALLDRSGGKKQSCSRTSK